MTAVLLAAPCLLVACWWAAVMAQVVHDAFWCDPEPAPVPLTLKHTLTRRLERPEYTTRSTYPWTS